MRHGAASADAASANRFRSSLTNQTNPTPMKPWSGEASMFKTDISHLATKAELHKELHLLTWRLLGLLTAQTTLILGAMYYMLSHR